MAVNNQMKIAREEKFGPVLPVIPRRVGQEAVAIANDSAFGLMVFINSADTNRVKTPAQQPKAGRVPINTTKHDPPAPIGGYKNSGIGGENGWQAEKSF